MKNKETHSNYPPKDEFNLWSQNILELVDNTNIPYNYLPPNIRRSIPEIINKIILPNLQTKLRYSETTTIMQKEISRYKEIYTPEMTSPSEFVVAYRNITKRKIEIQNKMATIITSAIEARKIDKDKAQALLKESDSLEPMYFAISSQAKTYTDYCQELIFSSTGNQLSEEEKWLIITPSQTACYIQKELDVAEYFSDSQSVSKTDLANRYFNSDPYLTEKYLSKIKPHYSRQQSANIAEAKIDQEIQTNRKIYFLLERKIPLARELDDISVMDHCFDKYLESKLCFLHDLFLKIILNQPNLSSFNFPNNVKDLVPLVVNTIEFR